MTNPPGRPRLNTNRRVTKSFAMDPDDFTILKIAADCNDQSYSAMLAEIIRNWVQAGRFTACMDDARERGTLPKHLM